MILYIKKKFLCVDLIGRDFILRVIYEELIVGNFFYCWSLLVIFGLIEGFDFKGIVMVKCMRCVFFVV